MTQQLQAAQWYRQKSSTNGDEAFWPGKHKTFAELEEDRLSGILPPAALTSKSGYLEYTCIPDARRFNTADPDYIIPINIVRHVTVEEASQWIVEEGGFRGLRKRVATVSPDQNYLWWSAHYRKGDLWRDLAEKTAEDACDYDSFPKTVFVPSYLFMNKDQRGEFGFFYQFSHLLAEYKKQFCNGRDPILRILGTFVYNQEIMAAVVVHSPQCDDLFAHLPQVTDAGDRVFQGFGDLLFWCPESIVRRTSAPYSPWERLALAFHLPDNDSVFKTEDPLAHRFPVDSEFPRF